MAEEARANIDGPVAKGPGTDHGQRSADPSVNADREALRLRLRLQTRRDRMIFGSSTMVLAGTGVIFLSLALSVDFDNANQNYGDPTKPVWPWVTAGCVALALVGIVFFVYIWRHAGRQTQLELADLAARTEETVKAASSSTDLGTLLAVNRALLEQYHQLSTGQSRSAFRLAQGVMVAAATLILIGCGLAVLANNTATSVTIASLSGLASSVGGYIATTLLRSYQISVRQAEVFFREPVVAGYMLAAERIARTLSDDVQQQALSRVVDGFMQAATGIAQPSPDPSAHEQAAVS
ncbi:uncharacterized membrane protein HdeD (DUF308 family) [Catenulispora sp. EB89]|uniref:TRADD-N-associated membrane domain-containing protein n=1 Tax=Catenulispora sp. EB89 TaxID=3156257 RepID=UPI003513F9EF